MLRIHGLETVARGFDWAIPFGAFPCSRQNAKEGFSSGPHRFLAGFKVADKSTVFTRLIVRILDSK